MIRRFLVAIAFVALAVPAEAQAPLRFRWTAGQVQTYSVRHTTSVIETSPGGAPVTTSVTKLELTKTWTAKTVAADGSAAFEMAVTAFRTEIARTSPGPDGKPATDTTIIDSSTAEGAKQAAAYMNKPILTATVDPQGQVSEVKSATGEQAAAKLQAELPFRVMLPAAAPKADATWDRTFTIKLDPPVGTGESYEAKQMYTMKGTNAGALVLGVATVLTAPPAAGTDLMPLLPWLWEGHLYLDATAGTYRGAKLTVKKDIPNHAGPGSKFAFASEYTEALFEKAP